MADPTDPDETAPPVEEAVVDQQAALVEAVEEGEDEGSAAAGA
jgi:hypothetical protein